MGFITFEESGLPQDGALKNLFNIAQCYMVQHPNLQNGGNQKLRETIEAGFNALVDALHDLQVDDVDPGVATRAMGAILVEESMVNGQAYANMSSADSAPDIADTLRSAIVGSPHEAFFLKEIYIEEAFFTKAAERPHVLALEEDNTPENSLIVAFAALNNLKSAVKMKECPDFYPPKVNATKMAHNGYERLKVMNVPESIRLKVDHLHRQLTQG